MKRFVMIPILLVLLLLTMEQGNAFDCEATEKSLFPCGVFIIGGSIEPSTSCCSAVQNLKASTPTPDDKRNACICLKEVASHYPNIREDIAATLPQRCGVDINFTISKNMDCDNLPPLP
ncbi:unnamed protein product [Trifolium pratense]|uniref:Uncharacterized protein n=1 Tax=Trifolium pratense TaxID=57577 RepID=A0ACB0M2V3_TRIPR|nr:unnamed protein product [Trifolium pratense]